MLSRDAEEKKQENKSTFGWCGGRVSSGEVTAFDLCHDGRKSVSRCGRAYGVAMTNSRHS